MSKKHASNRTSSIDAAMTPVESMATWPDTEQVGANVRLFGRYEFDRLQYATQWTGTVRATALNSSDFVAIETLAVSPFQTCVYVRARLGSSSRMRDGVVPNRLVASVIKACIPAGFQAAAFGPSDVEAAWEAHCADREAA